MTTQQANATYQEIIDLHTEKDTISVLGIHTPSTSIPVRMLEGFWKQFNKFRYNGCSMVMVPAARLPADPLGVSYAAGEPTIDPRDMLNPILFKGCHGNDMGKILNGFYETGNIAAQNNTTPTTTASNLYHGLEGEVKLVSSDNPDIDVVQTTSLEQNVKSTVPVGDVQLESLYYRALTDRTWKKAHPQAGLRLKGLHPLVYNVATTRSLGNSGVVQSAQQMPGDYGPYDGASINASSAAPLASGPSASAGQRSLLSEEYGEPYIGAHPVQGPQSTFENGTGVRYRGVYDTPFYTPSTRPLGWMDTRLRDDNGSDQVSDLNGSFGHDAAAISGHFVSSTENYATVPKIYMGMCLLPRAYKTEMYFRVILTHSFSFKGFRGQSMTTSWSGDVTRAPGYWNLN